MSRVEKIGITISVIFIAWVALSFVEVITHNLESGYVYNSLNAFQVLKEARELWH